MSVLSRHVRVTSCPWWCHFPSMVGKPLIVAWSKYSQLWYPLEIDRYFNDLTLCGLSNWFLSCFWLSNTLKYDEWSGGKFRLFPQIGLTVNGFSKQGSCPCSLPYPENGQWSCILQPNAQRYLHCSSLNPVIGLSEGDQGPWELETGRVVETKIWRSRYRGTDQNTVLSTKTLHILIRLWLHVK